MERRKFIRVLGGGVVTAASTGLAGCGQQQMPASAIEAWKGPGNEADLRRWVLAHAILAPHSHNLQSWLVDLDTPDHIVLRCDLTRLLPVTDPFSRQIMLSQGTFLELLDIAARERGQRAEITLFPEGVFGADRPDQRPVARIKLTPQPGLPKDPLFGQILARRTNRSLYAPDRPVPPSAWQAMADAVGPGRLHFDFVGTDRPAVLARHRAVAARAWAIEMTHPAALLESFHVLRVGAAEVAQHRDGLALLDPLVVLLDRVGLFDRSQAPAPDSYAIRSQIKDFDEKLESTPGFLWMVTEGNERTTQVDAGRAFARVQLAATAQGLAMQPLQQALQEYPAQAGPHAEIKALCDARQAGRTVQMWARVGFAPAVEPAARRGLDAHLRRA